MSADWEQLRLTLTTQGYEYDIYPLETVEPDQTKNATSIAVPGAAPTENIFLGISGMGRDISITFSLYDDGTDRANGTYSEPVTTVADQFTYLRDVMHQPAFSAAWELDHLTGDIYNGTPVFFENFAAPAIDRESPKWKQATLRLRVGQSV